MAIDIETFSSVNLLKSGVYRYVESPDFEILLAAYKEDDGPVKLIDLYDLNNNCPDGDGVSLFVSICQDLIDPQIIKTAFNANFERVCLQKFFGITLPVEQWECTQVKASYMGLPNSLEHVAAVLKLQQRKDTAGTALIKYFCTPCKPTKVNKGRTRNLPEHDPVKWEKFKEYCIQDVKVESAIRAKLQNFKFPDIEKRIWHLDQKINDAGVMLDPELVSSAINCYDVFNKKLTTEAVAITELDNPNSVAQIKSWLLEQTGDDVDSLDKSTVNDIIAGTEDLTVKRMMQIRQQMSKSSVKKYHKMQLAMCSDHRVRGMFQYYGANRTGRWAGRLAQPHNYPRNYMQHLSLARKIVKQTNLELLELVFGNVPYTISQLLRTAFVPAPGHRFIIADFSAIEARVIAWLAGEKWRLDVFATHGKIYEASAAAMFKMNIDDVKKGSTQRDAAKVAELALGYQGAVGAMSQMILAEKTRAAENGKPWTYNPTEDEMRSVVTKWRAVNKRIVNYWEVVEGAAWAAVQDQMSQNIAHGIKFYVDKNILFIDLPSGRKLAYLKPRIGVAKGGGMALTYEGMEQTKKIWIRMDTYGGKLVENIVQAIARDCLAEAMLRLDKAGYKIVMHVHDEVVIEFPDVAGPDKPDINGIMSHLIPWAKGLPLAADSFESDYYKKD